MLALLRRRPAGAKTLGVTATPSDARDAGRRGEQAPELEHIHGARPCRHLLVVVVRVLVTAQFKDTGTTVQPTFSWPQTLLLGEPYLRGSGYDAALALAQGARGEDSFGYRAEFVQLVRLAEAAAALPPLEGRGARRPR